MSVTLTFQCKIGPIYSIWLYFKANSCVLFAVIMKSLCIHLDVEFTFACLSIYPRPVMAWAAIDQSCWTLMVLAYLCSKHMSIHRLVRVDTETQTVHETRSAGLAQSSLTIHRFKSIWEKNTHHTRQILAFQIRL